MYFDVQFERVPAYLRREIAKRMADRVDLRCEVCCSVFELSERRARDRKGKTVLCAECKQPALTAPTAQDRKWVGEIEPESREAALEGHAALR